MKYTVEIISDQGNHNYIPDLSRHEAVRTAKEEAKEHPDSLVFISWFRSSDGQHGYLNPGGNHDITGKSW